jgi:hypothetical protein
MPSGVFSTSGVSDVAAERRRGTASKTCVCVADGEGVIQEAKSGDDVRNQGRMVGREGYE